MRSPRPAPLRVTLAALAVLDLGLGLSSLLWPHFVLGWLWPAAHDDASVLLRRTGVIWLAFAFAQLRASQQPTPERLRLVAFLRWMDVPADVVWVWGAASGLSLFGWLAIGISPVINAVVGWLAWDGARRGVHSPS